MHNSRVGDIIKTCGLPGVICSVSFNNALIIGNKNAAVLPEPVCAQAIKSLSFIIIGMAFFWIGVGIL